MNREATLRRRIRFLVLLFICGLVLSGLTAIPLEWELSVLAKLVGTNSASPTEQSGLAHWILRVQTALVETNSKYPFMAYGTDWLAFGHFVIAIAFSGPLRDPVKNEWVITFGMIACALVVPYALIMGPIRGIPLYWRLIDSSFGILGIIPLWLCRQYIRELANLNPSTN